MLVPVRQDFGRHGQVRPDVGIQRLQPLAVLLRGPDVALAQQRGQVGDVAAQRRQFGVGARERGDCAGSLFGRFGFRAGARKVDDIGTEGTTGMAGSVH